MFSISEIALFNFKSYRGKHRLKLPTVPGLYYLTGQNDFEPALEANGAGKSTLLDAIRWCLYGTSTRKLRGGDVITWGESSAWVEVTLQVGEHQLVVYRSQSPNSLLIKQDGKSLTVEQDELEKRLRLNSDSFDYSVISPQFGKSFFERSPGEKLEVFSAILNLDSWLTASKTAAEQAKALDRERIEASAQLAGIDERVKAAKDELHQLEIRSGVFKEDQREIVAGYDDEAAEVREKIKHLKQSAQATVNTYVAKVDGHQAKLERLVADAEAGLKAQGKLREQITRLEVQIEGVENSLGKLERVGATCPTCLQPVDAGHIAHERRALLSKRTSMEEELRGLNKQLEKSAKAVAAVNGDLQRTRRDLENARDAQRAEAAAVAQAASALKMAVQRLNELEARAQAEADALNPYAPLMATKREAIADLKAKKTKLTADVDDLQARHAATAYWVSGFKQLRLMIIEETLRTLEVEVNNTLASLGLVDWSIELEVEKEKKTGGVTKGFHVFVSCPGHDKPVKWESWSGGEAQRLQQAGDFGLADLIMSQAGLKGRIEFYDEPSAHLSAAGLLDLAETLHQRALTQKKVIILIDHHTIDFGEFAAVCRVTKDEDGSYFGNWE